MALSLVQSVARAVDRGGAYRERKAKGKATTQDFVDAIAALADAKARAGDDPVALFMVRIIAAGMVELMGGGGRQCRSDVTKRPGGPQPENTRPGFGPAR